MKFTEVELIRSVCRESYKDFVLEFWNTITAERLQWNWHMDILCDELQLMAEDVMARRPRWDRVINISPGTSKSSLCSVLFPPWVWTRMPNAQFICPSYSYPLALDLSNKSRDVVKSEKYKACFPEIVLRADQDTKGFFKNKHGGYRYAVGSNGTVMGFHGHFICLPGETEIVTEVGSLPIERIVDNKMRVRILGYDHTTGTTRWQEIRDWERNPGRPLSRIRFADGGVLELTADHPVYVPGRGYTFPTELRPGDRVYHAGDDQLRLLQKGIPLQAETDTNVRIWEHLLQSEMCGRTEAYQSRNLRELWNGESACRGTSVLFGEMPIRGTTQGNQQLPSGRTHPDPVSAMWCGDGMDAGGFSATADPMLLAGVRGSSAFASHDRGRELELHERAIPPSVHTGVRPAANVHPSAGRLGLLSLRQNQGREQQSCHVDTPHRLQQGQQRPDESDVPVHVLPRVAASELRDTPAPLGVAVVESVVHGVRLPRTVYNLRVDPCHNFFAAGRLVHNCIDDPIDPNKALSEAEMASTNHWIKQTLRGRKVDKTITPTLLVMQRLHQDDPSAQALRRKRVKHICIPADDTYAVVPPELGRFYINGLMDPVRLPRDVLDEERSPDGLGDYGFAGQYGQNPVPASGGMFKSDRIRPGRAPLSFRKQVRYWDKAATQGAGDWTVGVKMGEDYEGRIWVLDVKRFRFDTFTREKLILKTARQDGRGCTVGLEQEPGSGGKDSMVGTARRLRGFRVLGGTVRGDKQLRADEFSVAVNAGLVYIPDTFWAGAWVGWAANYVDELKHFPFSTHDDQVDASSGAYNVITSRSRRVGGMKRRKDRQTAAQDAADDEAVGFKLRG